MINLGDMCGDVKFGVKRIPPSPPASLFLSIAFSYGPRISVPFAGIPMSSRPLAVAENSLQSILGRIPWSNSLNAKRRVQVGSQTCTGEFALRLLAQASSRTAGPRWKNLVVPLVHPSLAPPNQRFRTRQSHA